MRRLTAAAGIAAALLALTACRSQPDVAAYVGDTTFTEAEVTRLINQVKAIPNIEPEAVPTRERVVNWLVTDKVCQRAAKDSGVTVPPTETQPGQPDLVAVNQRVEACRQALPVPKEPVQPTEAQLREVYDNGVAVGAIDPADPQQSFELLAPRLAASGDLGAAVSKRELMTKAAKAENVSVNPRYRTITFPLLEFDKGPALTVKIGQTDDAVKPAELPSPPAPAAG